MEGQQLYQKIHNSVCLEETMFISALQGHSGKNVQIEKEATHHFCTIWDSQERKIQ